LQQTFTLYSIGRIHNRDDSAWIEVEAPYRDAMMGLEKFSHIQVLYWFHKNDTPEGRSVLQVHPCRNLDNPLTGVFATHSPKRPNLIALTRCRIKKIDDLTIHIDAIDARDSSPLLDIKAYFPPDNGENEIVVPKWRRRPTDN